MSENILVVEYEPRYTDRVRQALAGQPITPWFARDGEEAMRALEGQAPRLIVLSSVVPKISTSELIRAIRGRKPLQETPILLTVSGYNGKSPRQDAQRMGASDILPKPYSESEFLGKIQQMLGIRADGAPARTWSPDLDSDFTVRASSAPTIADAQQFTSNEIFGELLDDDRAPAPAASRKSMAKPKDDVDKMLADTLAGVMPQRKKDPSLAQTAPGTTPVPPVPLAPPPAAAKPTSESKPRTSSAELDQLLNDTLSGLEKRKTTVAPAPAVAQQPAPAPAAPKPAPPPAAAAPTPAPRPVPAPTPAPMPPAAAASASQPLTQDEKYKTGRVPQYVPDRVPVSQPVFTKAPEPGRVEEEEPTDGVKFGQYILIEKIATGGMAEVWKARMRGVEGFQKIVAIKKILPHLSDNQDFIEMFVDEAKLAAQLNHNNIIHIYDLGKIQNSYYIAMEYVDGHDLKTILRRGGDRDQPMSVELALFVASKVAAALDYAHRKRDFEDRDLGLVHRDVSPQNVLVSQDGDIKLCDFGIAKAASKASHTQAGALKGKLQYMSPEQAWGRSIDKRSDIFALATVLFEMLTNRKLFTGDNELSILEQVREARVVPPSEFNDEVTPEIDAIVLKALQKDPAHRYQTAGEMAKDIDSVLYTFKPTPTSADLAIYMHRIWSPEPIAPPTHQVHEPEPERAPNELRPLAPPPAAVATPAAAAAAAVHPPAHAAPSVATYDEPKKKSPAIPIAIAAVVLLAVAGGAWFAMKRGSDPAATTTAAGAAPQQTASVAPAAPLATGTAPAATDSATIAATESAIVAANPQLDPAQVAAEVQRRLAAERARLEQQRAAQTATTATTAPARPAAPVPTATQAPAPVPAPVQTATQAPPPAPVPVPQVTETRAPAPEPVAAAPAPAAPARAREGDLIPAGTEGLTPARVIKRANVPYPPLARAQRVEGTVIVSVLVSEKGDAVDVRVVRGVNRPVGLNEAAVQMMRRSNFSPATKDGVRVRTWITVPVDFKL